MIEKREENNRVESYEGDSEQGVSRLRGALVTMRSDQLEGSQGVQVKEEQEAPMEADRIVGGDKW